MARVGLGLWIGTAGLVLIGAGAGVYAQGAAQTRRPTAPAREQNQQPPSDSQVARGAYLVNDVAQCWRCHTPPEGRENHTRWLMGGPVDIRPTRPVDDWAIMVPRIAGRPAGTDDEFIRLMTTGIMRTGRPPRQPMLQNLHMTQEDAQAVLAYLKSIGSPSSPAPSR
jgi:mono/diheme cytochrome c family protein